MPALAEMLGLEDAYRLSRATKDVVVCFEALALRTRCKMPRELAVARLFGGKWTAERAVALLQDAPITPYKTKKNMVRHLFRHVLARDSLYSVGYTTNNVLAMRLALKMKYTLK